MSKEIVKTAQKAIEKKGENTLPSGKVNVYLQFVLWSAMPPMERVKLGIEDQNQFCDYYKIGINTPKRWKDRPDFQDRVNKILKIWAFDQKPAIVQGIYRSAVKGNSDSQRIWLQYFEGWTEKSQVEVTNKVEVSPNDIRFLIEGLPEPLKTKHYGNLRELFDDANAVKHARLVEDDIWSERPEIGLHGEADHDAQELPVESGNEVAGSYTSCIRSDVERPAYSYHYQGAARRW